MKPTPSYSNLNAKQVSPNKPKMVPVNHSVNIQRQSDFVPLEGTREAQIIQQYVGGSSLPPKNKKNTLPQHLKNPSGKVRIPMDSEQLGEQQYMSPVMQQA